MTAEDLQNRTKNFSLKIIKLFKQLPNTTEAKVLGKQLLRSATSVTANYRAACRGRSRKEFYSKLSIVVEEADETLIWLELMLESGISGSDLLGPLKVEARQLLAIFCASRKTAKNNMRKIGLNKLP